MCNLKSCGILFLSLMCFAAISCGGGGSSSSAQTGPEMTPEARQAAVEALDAKYIELMPRSHPENRAAFIAAVIDLPGFREAGWSEEGDNLCAVFDDGQPFVFLDNRKPDDSLSSSQARPNTTAAVPRDKNATLMFSLGTMFKDQTTLMEGMLDQAGYSATKSPGLVPTLIADKKIYGYMYWSTHSGFLKDGTPVITTLSTWDSNIDQTEPFKTLLHDHLLIRSGGHMDRIENPVDANHNGQIDEEERVTLAHVYAVTPEFIQTYMHFGPGSVVVQDSCTSADAKIQQAFSAAGASVYLGWDAVTKDSDRMALFTDRLLGTNTFAPYSTPPLRPFEAPSVLAWMRANGLDSDGATSHLKEFYKPGPTAGILSPSIESISIEEGVKSSDPDIITVKGIFGAKDDVNLKRELFVAGQPLSITGGDDDEIIGIIPTSGLGSSGNCMVKIGGRSSNIVPISSWDLLLTNAHDDALGGTAKIEIKFHLRFRGDVHKRRTLPGSTATGPVVTMTAKSDSTATWTASGGYDDCTLSGSGSLKAGNTNRFNGPEIVGLLAVDVNTGAIVTSTAYAVGPTYVITCPDSTSEQVVQSVMADAAGLPNFPLQFQPGTFTIQGDSLSGSFGDIQFSWNWSTAEPTFPPTPDTQS